MINSLQIVLTFITNCVRLRQFLKSCLYKTREYFIHKHTTYLSLMKIHAFCIISFTFSLSPEFNKNSEQSTIYFQVDHFEQEKKQPLILSLQRKHYKTLPFNSFPNLMRYVYGWFSWRSNLIVWSKIRSMIIISS